MKNEFVSSILNINPKDLPDIKLVENERIELIVKRSPIYLILIWAGEVLVSMLILALLIYILSIENLDSYFNLTNGLARAFLVCLVFVVFGVVFIAGLITTKVYTNNKLYVTNKRVIQKVMTSLFSGSTNVIDLVSIEDVSFKKAGILEYIFKIGTLRMSTVGDETTYNFKYVDTPTDELEKITYLVHTEKEKQKEIPDTHIIQTCPSSSLKDNKNTTVEQSKEATHSDNNIPTNESLPSDSDSITNSSSTNDSSRTVYVNLRGDDSNYNLPADPNSGNN